MKLRILLKSFDDVLIGQASKHLTEALTKTDCTPKGTVYLPTKIKRFCVLRSPHIDKDSREHFEVRLYKCFIDFEANSPSILDVLFKTKLPAGISCSLKFLKT